MSEKMTKFTFRVGEDLLNDFKKCVPNASEDLRKYMQKRVNQKTNLDELQKLRLDKILERESINIEIDNLEEDIEEAKIRRHQNNLDKTKLNNAMDTVKAICTTSKVNGITRDKVTEIAENNEINPSILVNECKKHEVKFISKKQEEINSTIRVNKENEKPKDQSIINLISRQFKTQKNKYNNDLNKFLDDPDNKNKFQTMANNAGVDYTGVINKIEKLHKSNKLN